VSTIAMSHSFSQALKDFKIGARTPREFLEECADAIRTREKTVKAFVMLDLRAARASADAATRRYKAGRPLSPIDGCPIAVKDIIATADMPTQMNSPIYKGWRPKCDAACVAALRRGGAVIIGKTVTTEFAIGRSGPTTNPCDPKRTPGGSSSGSAAAVAAGMAPAALGTQTQGSILRPASYCGVVGFKPTIGALHSGGIHLLSPTCDHLGVIAASVEDAWGVASQISLGAGSPGVGFLAGAGAKAPTQHQPERLIRLYTRGWEELDAPTRNTFDEAIERLQARGIEIASRHDDPEVADLEEQLERGIDGQMDIVAYEMKWPYGDYIARYGTRVGPRIGELVERAHHMTPAAYNALLANRRRMEQLAATVLARCDGFVTLASSGPATVGLTRTGSRTFPSYASWLGLPAFSLPLMTVRELPVGIQVIGRAGGDGELCGVARWMMRWSAG
jgi:Asp-tRNA(Asn)/Glu-tRNA(Gln) amidotransferase A subunit family amidase